MSFLVDTTRTIPVLPTYAFASLTTHSISKLFLTSTGSTNSGFCISVIGTFAIFTIAALCK
jgi:hypothetical protein